MEFSLDPNLAYLLLSGGLILAILSLLSPGTGILEISALFALILSGWAMYILPVNWWALMVILAGGVLFFFSARKAGKVSYLVLSITALVLGSAFMFRSDVWYIPAVNPFLAAAVSIASGGFFWIVARKVLEASAIRPTHDLEALVGRQGEAKTDIHSEGSVQVAGELWSAYSDQPIPSGEKVRVVRREGFVLKVEAI